MPADGNGTPRPSRTRSAPVAASSRAGERVWIDRAPPGPAAGKVRRHADPAAEAMSRNPNLSPPIHFDHEH